MTNKEFIDKTMSSLDTLGSFKTKMELRNKYTLDIDNMIHCVRYRFICMYYENLWRFFRPFCSPNEFGKFSRFAHDDAYVCDSYGVAIRSDNNQYRALKILNPDTYWNGVLQTECHDDFPFHVFPESYKGYDYPEIAMVMFIASRVEGFLEEECFDDE